MFTLLRVIIILKHLVEHEVEKFLICDEKLYKFLTFNLRKFFDFLWRPSLYNPEIRLKEVWLSLISEETCSRVVELRIAIHLFQSIFEFHLDELLPKSLPMRMNAVDEDIAQLINFVRFEIDIVSRLLPMCGFFKL